MDVGQRDGHAMSAVDFIDGGLVANAIVPEQRGRGVEGDVLVAGPRLRACEI